MNVWSSTADVVEAENGPGWGFERVCGVFLVCSGPGKEQWQTTDVGGQELPLLRKLILPPTQTQQQREHQNWTAEPIHRIYASFI